MIFVTLLGLLQPVSAVVVVAAAVIVAAAAALAAAIVAAAAEESCVPLLPRKPMNTAVLVWDTISAGKFLLVQLVMALGDHGNTEWLAGRWR